MREASEHTELVAEIGEQLCAWIRESMVRRASSGGQQGTQACRRLGLLDDIVDHPLSAGVHAGDGQRSGVEHVSLLEEMVNWRCPPVALAREWNAHSLRRG